MKRNNDSSELTPTQTHGGSTPHDHTYTSGTYNEALTGHYHTNRADTSPRGNRPMGHGKATDMEPGEAEASRGERVQAAQRGVGQETVDGRRESWENYRKRAAVAAFIKALVANKFNN